MISISILNKIIILFITLSLFYVCLHLYIYVLFHRLDLLYIDLVLRQLLQFIVKMFILI